MVDDRIKQKIEKYISQLLRDNLLNPGTLNFAPRVQLSITQAEKSKKKLYQNLLKPFGIQVLVNPNQLQAKPLVQVQVLICQVSQNFFRQLGIAWPTQVRGDILADFNLQFPNQSNHSFSANLIENHGFGRVVASPTLVTRSHSPANFHSGGEFPIQTGNAVFSQVQWKKHGILVKILPKVDQLGKMEIEITAEISLLDHSKAQNGIPALEKSKMTSTFFLEKPRPIVLSGLVKQSWRNQKGGIPLLQQIPIFDALFSQKQRGEDYSDLVFIVESRVLET